MKKQLKQLGVAAFALVASASSFAAGIDLSADVTAAKADVITNGTVVMGVVVAVATFAWIRRVLR